MPKKKNDSKRKTVSKKTRFEVFKRDSFTCQYCGRKAPDVILEIDHITPVSKGGDNDMLNLITSCKECNSGKTNIPLDDSSAVIKRQKQAEELQARREQIEMLRDWHLELADEHRLQLESINELYKKLTNYEYIINSEYLNKEISKMVARYGVAEVMSALLAGYETYGDAHKSLDKLGGILFYRNNPDKSKRGRIIAYMEKHFPHMKKWRAKELLTLAYNKHGEPFYDFIIANLPAIRNWTQFVEIVNESLED